MAQSHDTTAGPRALSLSLRCELANCETARQALQQLLEPHASSAGASFVLDVLLEDC